MFWKETLWINRLTICFAGHEYERKRKLESDPCGQPKAQKCGNTTILKCFLMYMHFTDKAKANKLLKYSDRVPFFQRLTSIAYFIDAFLLFITNTDESDDLGADENMRRSSDMAKFFGGKWHNAIGIIQYQIDSSTNRGTGFRVGSKYIMTAFHVMEGYFSKSLWSPNGGCYSISDDFSCSRAKWCPFMVRQIWKMKEAITSPGSAKSGVHRPINHDSRETCVILTQHVCNTSSDWTVGKSCGSKMTIYVSQLLRQNAVDSLAQLSW